MCPMTESKHYGIDLFWIPLGAGGWFVRWNGRVWEAAQARKEHRRPAALYHTGLEIHVPDGRYVIENAWPIPDALGAGRGVVVEGPVFSRHLGRVALLRYEVRCWQDGEIPDAPWAVGGPQRITDDVDVAERVLAVLPAMAPHVWGRKAPGTGDMWNSNSIISWALMRSGFPAAGLEPPGGGRAPGWRAGIAVAEQEMRG